MKIDRDRPTTATTATATAKTNKTGQTASTTVPTFKPNPVPVPASTLAPMRITLRGGSGPGVVDSELESTTAPTTVSSPRTNPPTSSGRSFAFDAPYRFHDVKTGLQTAFLEQTGRLHIRDDQGSLEVWEHARYFIVDCLKKNPAKTPDDMLNQLWEVFGPPQMVRPEKASRRTPTETGHGSKPTQAGSGSNPAGPAQPQSGADDGTSSDLDPDDESGSEGANNDMANAKTKTVHMMGRSQGRQASGSAKKATGAVKTTKHAPATKKTVDKAELKDCGCGCGDKCGTTKSSFLPGHDARFHGQIKRYVRGDLKFGDLNETIQRHIRKEGIKQEAK